MSKNNTFSMYQTSSTPNISNVAMAQIMGEIATSNTSGNKHNDAANFVKNLCSQLFGQDDIHKVVDNFLAYHAEYNAAATSQVAAAMVAPSDTLPSVADLADAVDAIVAQQTQAANVDDAKLTQLQHVQGKLKEAKSLLARNDNIKLDINDHKNIVRNIHDFKQNSKNLAAVVDNDTISMIFNVDVNHSLNDVSALAVMILANFAYYKTISSVIGFDNALSKLQQHMVKLAQEMGGVVTSFYQIILNLYNKYTTEADNNNSISLNDMSFTQTSDSAKKLKDATKQLAQHPVWVSTWPFPVQTKGADGPPHDDSKGTGKTAINDYWNSTGFSNPAQLYFLTQCAAVCDFRAGQDDLPPEQRQVDISQEYLENHQDDGSGVSFLVADASASYTGDGTTDGKINNAITIDSDLFSMIAPQCKSTNIMYTTFDDTYEHCNKTNTSPVAYLNLKGFMNMCNTVSMLASAFVATDGITTLLGNFFGATATYKTITAGNSSFSQSLQNVAQTSDTSAQAAQTQLQQLHDQQQNLVQLLGNFSFKA